MAEATEIPKDQVEALEKTILEGIQNQFKGSGFLNMDIPYDPKNPPSPDLFANSIKELVAKSIAIGVVQYLTTELPKALPTLIPEMLPDAMQEIFKSCTVEVKDPAGQVIGTGTIQYTKPQEGK